MIISAMSKKDSKTFNFRLLNSEIGNDRLMKMVTIITILNIFVSLTRR